MEEYEQIIRNFRIVPEDIWFFTNNPSNDLPYHNRFHSQCMVVNCYDGAQYYNLPYEATRQLLIAAMFHDFGHTGGKEDDTVNIGNALVGYHRLGEVMNAHEPIVVDCIRCTQYPFVVTPFTIEHRIIRDADLMQFRFPNWEKVYFEDLKKEMEIRMHQTITDHEMIMGNRKFWADVMFFTDWGVKMVNEAAPYSFTQKLQVPTKWVVLR